MNEAVQIDGGEGKIGGIDSYWLKVLAITGMLCNHIGHVFGESMPYIAKCIFYAPGGLTFPIMAFLMTEGYRRTSNVKRYMLRLLLFAVATQPVYMWAFRFSSNGIPVMNVLFTLLLGLCVLWLNDHLKSRALFWFSFIGITLCTAIFDWGIFGVPLVFFMNYIKGRNKRIVLPILVMVALMVGALVLSIVAMMFVNQADPEMFATLGVSTDFVKNSVPDIVYFIGSIIALFALLKYNGKRGRNMKYFFYIFYPGHLLILVILRGLIFGDWAFV